MGEIEIELQKVSLSDAEEFGRIKAETYADDRLKCKPDEGNVPEWYNGEWYQGLAVFDEAEAKRLINTFDCYKILLGDSPIGIFWLHCEAEGSLSLEDFCILPRYQGKGYGTRVLKLIEELYPKNKVWMLGTPYFCKRNRHLYEKVGYKYDGMVSNNTVVLYKKVIEA